MYKPLAFTLFLLILSACSSVQKSGVAYYQEFDFSTVKTFGLYERNTEFSEHQNLLDASRNAIEIAIENTMVKQNFHYTSTQKADVIVTYHLLNGKKRDYSKYNKIVRFCSYCLRASAWQINNKYEGAKFGSLVLDIVDPQKQRSVWRGIYPLAIKVQDNSAETNEKIQQAVSSMLAHYPKF